MAYERYLQESGSSYLLLESGAFLLLESSDLTAPATPAPAETPAGRPTRRLQNYIVRLDGQEFNCRSLDQVYNILEQAKALARKLSQERVRAATEPRASVKPLSAPEIIADSRDVRPAVMEARREIREIYKAANRDIEIALWFAAEQEKEDEDLSVLFLM